MITAVRSSGIGTAKLSFVTAAAGWHVLQGPGDACSLLGRTFVQVLRKATAVIQCGLDTETIIPSSQTYLKAK